MFAHLARNPAFAGVLLTLDPLSKLISLRIEWITVSTIVSNLAELRSSCPLNVKAHLRRERVQSKHTSFHSPYPCQHPILWLIQHLIIVAMDGKVPWRNVFMHVRVDWIRIVLGDVLVM